MTPNEAAFLTMISTSEGTDMALDPYRVCFGYRHVIQSFADHPAITGEWMGEPLTGAYSGEVSTAAGRYQMRKATWMGCRDNLGLPDFGPDSQDAAALYLIKQRGAWGPVNRGDIASAIDSVRTNGRVCRAISLGSRSRNYLTSSRSLNKVEDN